MRRSTRYLVLLTVLAMLTFALAVPITSGAEPTLTAEQQKKLATLMAAHGHDVQLDSGVGDARGISKGKESVTIRQLTVNEHPILHTYAPLSDGGVMLILLDSGTAWCYRLDAYLKVIAGVAEKEGLTPSVLPLPEAEQKAQVELPYWAAVANRH